MPPARTLVFEMENGTLGNVALSLGRELTAVALVKNHVRVFKQPGCAGQRGLTVDGETVRCRKRIEGQVLKYSGSVGLFRILIAIVLATLALPSVAAPSRLAVVIGNGKYQHEQPLKNPSNDARAVAASLRSSGQFDTVVERYDLLRRQLLALMLEVESLGVRRDAILVYFAGPV